MRSWWRPRTGPSSLRAARALHSWNSTNVVNAIVAAVALPVSSRAAAKTATVPAAMTAPARVMAARRRMPRMRSSGERGGRRITLPRGGSTPSAIAGGPSMMMLIHSSWIADIGAGSPASTVTSSVRIAPMLVDSWNRTNVTMLS